jgi:serine/threonine-protein kinase
MPDLLQGRYEIIKQLSNAGGFGETLLAIDRHWPSQRQCVIKRFRPKQRLDVETYRIVRERFEREAAVLETLAKTCQQVPKLYAYFNDGQDYYIVQEFIEGRTLSQIVRGEGPLLETAVKQLLFSLLKTLCEIHTQGIIHRDIKPDNIILRKESNLPVLIDFGAVKEVVTTVVDKFGTPQHSSLVIGTSGYAPTEQAAGRPVFASDLYSLALTMIYALTGLTPLQHQTDPASGALQWRKHADGISAELVCCLDKAIELNYRDRYHSAQAMLEALTESLKPPPHQVAAKAVPIKEAPLVAPSRPQPELVKAPVARHRAKLAATALAVLLTMGGGYGLYTLLSSSTAVEPTPTPTVTPAPKRPSLTPTAKPAVTPKAIPMPSPKSTPPVSPEPLRQQAAAAVGRARGLYKQRQYDRAISECNRALQLDPGNREARELKGQIERTLRILEGK